MGDLDQSYTEMYMQNRVRRVIRYLNSKTNFQAHWMTSLAGSWDWI